MAPNAEICELHHCNISCAIESEIGEAAIETTNSFSEKVCFFQRVGTWLYSRYILKKEECSQSDMANFYFHYNALYFSCGSLSKCDLLLDVQN